MKYRMRLFLIVFSVWIVSCTQLESVDSNKKNFPLLIIDNYLQKGASLEEIKSLLGEPGERITYKNLHQKAQEFYKIPKDIAFYNYYDKVTKFQEWSFTVNSMGKVEGMAYTGSHPLLDRVEVLPETWKKYRCKNKVIPDTRNPNVIQDETFFECVDGRIKAYYNKYGEIESITVAR